MKQEFDFDPDGHISTYIRKLSEKDVRETRIIYSSRTNNFLQILGQIVKEFLKDVWTGSLLPALPVIAGGAIRDQYFGLIPNDYDIFFSTKNFEDSSEVEDFAVLLGSYIGEQLANRVNKLLFEDSFGMIKEYGDKTYTKEDQDPLNFIVADLKYNTEEREAQINNYADKISPQLIGRSCEHLAKGDYEKFVETFDYAYVKAWFNIDTMTYHYSSSFDYALKNPKSLNVEEMSEKTWTRFYLFSSVWKDLRDTLNTKAFLNKRLSMLEKNLYRERIKPFVLTL